MRKLPNGAPLWFSERTEGTKETKETKETKGTKGEHFWSFRSLWSFPSFPSFQMTGEAPDPMRAAAAKISKNRSNMPWAWIRRIVS